MPVFSGIIDAAGNMTYDGQYKFTYDAWNRLTTFHRGDLDGEKDEIPTGGSRFYGEAWGLTPTGDWNDYQINDNGDGDYTGRNRVIIENRA